MPEFIAAVPRDPIGGQPLRYLRTDAARFVLYSVGWNETDDGGTVSVNHKESLDPNTGDWVWQFPDAPSDQ